MASNTKSTTKKTQASSHRSKRSSSYIRRRASVWIKEAGFSLIALSIVAITSWCYVLAHLSYLPYIFISPYPSLFFQPTFIALLIAIFSSLFVYRFTRGDFINKYARVVGYIFIALFSLAFIVLAAGYSADAIGRTCTGFFGAQTQCSSANMITLYIFLLNPFSLILYGILSVTGVMALLVKFRK